MNFIKDFTKGIFIGAGAILPGISSGVLCVIFGIYDKLVQSVLEIFKDFKKNVKYLFPIVCGGVIGIVMFGNALKLILATFPMQTKYAFIGLIIGSIPTLIKKVNSERYFRLHYLLYTFMAFIIGILTVLLENYISTNIITSNMNISNEVFYMVLILAGFFMSIGIVVPGVSSTIILMCFGIYDIYINSVANFNLSILIPLGIGVLIGGILFLNLISYLLKKFYAQTFYSIVGFTLGSVLVLYMPVTLNLAGIISIILLIAGFYIASFFETKQ